MLRFPFLLRRPAADPHALLREVRRLDLSVRGPVDTLLSGSYRSSFRGQGLEFHQVREYVPGDDVRAIDWNVTARLGAPFLKTYVEERELHLLLVVDASASLFDLPGRPGKWDTVLRLCAVLASAADRNRDRAGLLLFTDRVEFLRPPRRGRGGALRLLRDLLAFRPQGKRTRFEPALRVATRILKRRGVVVLVSDFTEPVPLEPARGLARRHDLTAVCVRHPLEDAPPVAARLRVHDPETGRSGAWRPGGRAPREAAAFREAQLKVLTDRGADRLDLVAGEDLRAPLRRFFQRRLDRAPARSGVGRR